MKSKSDLPHKKRLSAKFHQHFFINKGVINLFHKNAIWAHSALVWKNHCFLSGSGLFGSSGSGSGSCVMLKPSKKLRCGSKDFFSRPDPPWIGKNGTVTAALSLY